MTNEKGFTLVAVLAGLFLLTLVLPLFLSGYHFWMSQKPEINQFSMHEFYVFTKQLEKEFQQSESYAVTASNDRLLMNVDGKTVSYERYEDKIRRRVMSQGHEVTLQHITDYGFRKHRFGLEIWVTAGNKTRTRYLLHPAEWAEQKYNYIEGHNNYVLSGQ
jgi:competence protein ComGF